jgi:LysR family transcriptional regulator for metE and metH
MLEMVAAGRGVTAMPSWFIQEYSEKIPLHSVRLGSKGIFKSLHLGIRDGDAPAYLSAFMELARGV